MLSLTDVYGTVGIAAARLAGFTIMFLTIFYIEKRFFEKIQIKFWLKLLLTLGAAAAASVIFQNFFSRNTPISWATLFVSIAGGGIIYCLTLVLLGFINTEEKMLIKNLLKRSSTINE